MKKEHKKFIKKFKKYLTLRPELRITQALFNLGVNEKNVFAPDNIDIIDNYNQSDEKTIEKVKANYQREYKAAFKVCGKENQTERPLA